MTWGFSAVNDKNQVLVSSESRSLHYLGKATFFATLKSSNAYGGFRRWAFRIACNAPPLAFFSVPTNDYYAVAAVREISTGAWEIEVIRSGTSDTMPAVYVFCEPRGITRGPSTNYGMQVLMEDGSPAFDSRFNPLAVTGGVAVVPPSNPRIAGPGYLNPDNCATNASGSLAPDSKNIFQIGSLPGNPIFFYPSIAQAQREFYVSRSWRDCIGVDAYGSCVGYGEEYRKSSRYWAFYRSGIKRVGTEIYCGWITLEYGCNWDYKRSNSFLGIGVGGDSGIGGSWPYSNETLNLAPTPVISANGDRYDAL